jgi:L-asparagine transporter-like permease
MSPSRRSQATALGVGALVGLVVAGLGGRLAMRVVALADGREDFGLTTEGGNVVGDVTLGGTLFILLLGVAQGVLGALLYLALRRWLPVRPWLAAVVFALFVLGLGLGQVTNGNEADFVFVNAVVSLVAFGCVILVLGLVLPPLIERISPRRISPSLWGRGLVAAVVVLAVVFGAVSVNDALEIAAGERAPG